MASIETDSTDIQLSESMVKYHDGLFRIMHSVLEVLLFGQGDFESRIILSLRYIGRFANQDRAFIFVISPDGKFLNMKYEWYSKGNTPSIKDFQNIPIDYIQPWQNTMSRGEIVYIRKADEIPEIMVYARNLFIERSLQSLLCIPIVRNNKLYGVIGFDSVIEKHVWTKAETGLLQVFCKIIHYTLKMNEEYIRDIETSLYKYSTALKLTIDAVFITDKYGFVTESNSAALQLIGCNDTECLKGQNIFSFMLREDQRQIFSLVKKVLTGKPVKSFECCIINRSGILIPIEISLSMFNEANAGTEGYLVIARDISDRVKNEKELKSSLAEKEILLKEIHHRVKNNLQIISSILSLQRRYIDSPKLLAIIENSQTRIKAMSFVHETLYKSRNASRISTRDYFSEIVSFLYQTYHSENKLVTIYCDIEEIEMDLQEATPCGLILNELISNALKHAFSGELTNCEINVSFTHIDNYYILSVRDNGVGFPRDFFLNTVLSFGLRLVNILVDQIDGEISLDSTSGANIIIRFPYTREAK